MSLEVCSNCTARYAVGLESCPQCGSAEAVPNWVADAVPAVAAEPDAVLTSDGDPDSARADDDDPEGEPASAPAGLPVVPPAPEDGAVVT